MAFLSHRIRIPQRVVWCSSTRWGSKCDVITSRHARESARCVVKKLPNCPHKLTKTAEPWLGGGAPLGRLQLPARVTSAADRSCHFVLVAAAVVPLSRGRRGGRFLQLRVITLARPNDRVGISASQSLLFGGDI